MGENVTEIGERYKIYYIATGPMRGSCKHQHRTIYDAYHCLRHDFKAAQSEGIRSDRRVCAVEDGHERELCEPEVNQLDRLRRSALSEVINDR